MKEIQLTQGKVAIVDDENFESLNENKWYIKKDNKNYYALRNIIVRHQNKQKNIQQKLKTIMLHREIMEHKLNRKLEHNEHIDHINRDGLDNRECNLRLCNPSQNKSNSIKQKTYCGKPTTSIYKGVRWFKSHKKWRADIKYQGKTKYLGLFDNEKDAAKAYDQKAKELFGEFVRPNFGGSQL